MKIIIIGAGIAGITLAKRIKKYEKKHEVILIEKNQDIIYETASLPYYISDEIKNEELLKLENVNDLKSTYDIEINLDTELMKIDDEKKEITLMSGSNSNMFSMAYDKLILACGLKNIKLKELENVGDNIFIIKNIYNSRRLKKYLSNNDVKNALVIGAGTTGIMIAEMLENMNINTTVFEETNNILRQYDEDITSEIFKYLETKINIKTNINISKVINGKELKVIYNEEGKRKNNILKKGSQREKKFDVIIVTSGLVPNTEFLDNTKIQRSDKGYIFVDEYFETNINDIYAVGDIAVVKNKISSEYILPKTSKNAYIQARKLANNILGEKTKYTGSLCSNVQGAFNKIFGKSGITQKEAYDNNLEYIVTIVNDNNIPEYLENKEHIMIKGIFEIPTLRILGVQVFGGKYTDKKLDTLVAAISSNMTAYDLAELEIPFTPFFSKNIDIINRLGYKTISLYKEKP